MLTVGGRINGVFYENSKTTFGKISDGSSNSILIGERSGEIKPGGYYVDPDLEFFGSSWLGVVHNSDFGAWRVVGWTAEGPKNNIHTFAQFNSSHPGLTVFNFCDGSTHSLPDEIDWTVFQHLGSINGGEVLGEW